jgi:predicted ABC-type ATPase
MPVKSFGVDFFNADDEAAKLNGGSYHSIPQSVRSEINNRFERFIHDHIERGLSLAIETTLRSTIALDQAKQARDAGFYVEMHYIATETLEINLKRVMKRFDGGGHSAPIATLTDIREKSFRNLYTAINSVPSPLNELTIYDNSHDGEYMRPALHIGLPEGHLVLDIKLFDPPAYLGEYVYLAFWH